MYGMLLLFRTVSENSNHNIVYPKSSHHISSYLRAIEKVFFFYYLMHVSIKIYKVCSYSFKLSQEKSNHNIYPKLLPNMSSYLRAIEKAYPDIKAK